MFAAEMLGTAFLLAVVVGSGIMAERLAGGNVAQELLANSLATGAGLTALILTFGSVSGAHFNPVVTLVEVVEGRVSWVRGCMYVVAQTAGALAGVAAVHAIFDLRAFEVSVHARSGWPLLWSEVLATVGLLLVIRGCGRSQPASVPYAVGAYITAAYWFTSSTSFANPAVTLARTLTPTFAGIRSSDAPGFIAAQLLGAGIAILLGRWLFATASETQVKT
jgi:glycerol uptake facilitator-like aquaporin